MKKGLIALLVFAAISMNLGSIAAAAEETPRTKEEFEVITNVVNKHFGEAIEAIAKRDGYAALAALEKMDSMNVEITGDLVPVVRALAHRLAAEADLREIEQLHKRMDSLTRSAQKHLEEYARRKPEIDKFSK